MSLFGFFGISKVWTVAHWVAAFEDPKFMRVIGNTILLGFGTAIAAVVCYSLIAYCTVRVRHWLAGPLDVLSWLPFTVPGVLLGFGMLWMVLEIPLFSMFYGTFGILIVVCLLASMTLGIQVLKATMLQIGTDLEEAARIVGASWRRGFQDVMVPLTLPAVIVVGVMVLSHTVRQVSTLVLLSTGDTEPLALMQLEYLRTGQLGPAAVSGTLIVLFSLIAAAVVRVMTSRFGIQAR
jgi:iron(III) transport system permease protein